MLVDLVAIYIFMSSKKSISIITHKATYTIGHARNKNAN